MKRQISPKQLAANRANAARSTGPRSDLGKARAALNSRKHGLAATNVSILRLEDQNELDNLKTDALNRYQPQCSQEIFAVERIALAQLAMLRGYRLEAGLFIEALNSCLNYDESPIFRIHDELFPEDGIRRGQNGNFALGRGFEHMTKRSNCFSLLLRYQTQAERHYRRAVEEFDRLKRLREEIPNEPISDPQPLQTEPDAPIQNEPIHEPIDEPDSAPHTPGAAAPTAEPRSPEPLRVPSASSAPPRFEDSLALRPHLVK
jgi:hypothetical protein